MPTTTKSSKADDKSEKADKDESTPVDPVTAAALKIAKSRADLAAAEAEHAAALDAAKPKIGRWNPKKPTILVEGEDGETPVSLDDFNDKENGRDLRVGSYLHCANLSLSDEKGQYERWVYRKVGA